jgi:hypothetical protein
MLWRCVPGAMAAIGPYLCRPCALALARAAAQPMCPHSGFAYRGCAPLPRGSLASCARKPHAARVCDGLHAFGAVLLDGSPCATGRRGSVTPCPRAAVLIAGHECMCVVRSRRHCVERAGPHGVRSPPRELRLGAHPLLSVRRPAVHATRGVCVRARRAMGLAARQDLVRRTLGHVHARLVWRPARSTRRRRDKLRREGATVASGAAPRAMRRRTAHAPQPRRV